MKLQVAGTANRRISNIEPQNVEGRFRFAQSFFKIDRSTQKLTTGRIHYFDIHYSIFAFSEFLLRSDWTLAARGGTRMKLHLYIAKSKVLQSS